MFPFDPAILPLQTLNILTQLKHKKKELKTNYMKMIEAPE